LPAEVKRYQIDLLDLQWHDRWDMAFLLDVLEHIPQDEDALRQIHQALAPGGLLFITTPALRQFWTWNDDVNRHVRRYSRADYRRLAEVCGYRLIDARYFMFLLSPLLVGSRLLTGLGIKKRPRDEGWALLEKMHRVPNPVENGPLRLVFSLETPLGHYVSFPWGTSILAVLQKPTSR
jgi:SAM-dependent methyltransferase